jgi:hypothetical protein
MAYTKYSLTPADNNAAPPNGAPEGMLPSAVNDTMRDMMAQIRDVGDGIRGGTYTMTAPVITGGSITGVALSGNTLTNPVITGGSINNTTVGATTRSTGAFTTLASNGATTFTAGTASTSTTTGTAVITGGLGVSGRINAANFDGIVGANTAAAGNFTTLGATGVATFSAGTVSAPAITTTGDTNTGIFFPAADTIAFTEGGVEAMRIDSSGNLLVGTTATRSVGNGFQTATSKQFFNELASADLVGFTTVLNRNDSNALRFILGKSRGTAAGGVTTVQNADNLGVIMFAGADGTTLDSVAAQILAAVDGTPGTNDMPGRLVFSTTADGASSPTERMRIDSGGTVIVGNGANNDTRRLGFNTASGGTSAIESVTVGATNQALVFKTTFSTEQERMRIDGNGNVGIGNTIASTMDSNNGSGTLVVGSGSGSKGMTIFAGSTSGQEARLTFANASSGAGAYAAQITFKSGDNAVLFYNQNAERMRIDSSGNLLVNTSSVLLAGAGSIQAQAIGTGGAIMSKSSEWSTYTQYIWNATTANDSRFVSFNTEGTATERGSIDFNRGATLTRYNTTSDAALKNIIGDSDGKKSIDILKSTRIREYAWKEDVEQKPQVGVIAQELYETYKGAVSEGGEDANGNYKPWGVDKTAFTFHLIAGWQEHQKLIQELKTIVDAQAAQIAALESK